MSLLLFHVFFRKSWWNLEECLTRFHCPPVATDVSLTMEFSRLRIIEREFMH